MDLFEYKLIYRQITSIISGFIDTRKTGNLYIYIIQKMSA